MATQKFSDLTAVTTPNAESVFAIAHSGSNFKLTITDLAANLPATTATSLTTSGNATIGGDLTITGDDLTMGTNTSGAALIADGTNFNPVVISGDLTISTGGVAAIASGVIINADVNASAALAFSKMENLTASRLLVSDGSGDVSVSAVTSTEAGYLDGVSSAIQTQLDSKASSSYVPTTITVADESTDTTCFPLFVTAATGDLPPKSGTNLAFNSNSGILTATGFAGNITGNVTGNTSGSSGSCTGNSATASSSATLTTARTIGGVSFNGSANIDLPGVNTAGNQNTSGTAAGLSATLAVGSGGSGATSLTANGVLIGNGASAITSVDMSTKGKILIGDGSGNPQMLSVGTNGHVLTAASGETTGVEWAAVTAATPTAITVADESTDTTCFPLFVTAATGDLAPKSGSNLAFNSSSGILTATGFAGDITGNVTGNTSGTSGSTTGNAATATILATARDIGGVSFNGSASINLPGVNTAGNQNTSGTAAGLSATLATSSGGTGLTGAVVGKQTIYIPAAAMYPNTTAGCADLAQVELSNGPEIKVLDFDASSDEHAQFTVCFPKLWNEGTVTFQPFWTVTGTNTGTVAWGLSAVAFADNGDINTAFGTNVVTTAKAHSGTSNDLDVSAESGAVTIAGSPSVDEMVFFQIMRDVSADDQSGDARLLGVKLFFTTDSLTDA